MKKKKNLADLKRTIQRTISCIKIIPKIVLQNHQGSVGRQNFKSNKEYFCFYNFWHTLSQVKSPIQVQVQAHKWFSIKIQTATHSPTPHRQEKLQRSTDTAIFLKEKLLTYIREMWNMFVNKPRYKIHPL